MKSSTWGDGTGDCGLGLPGKLCCDVTGDDNGLLSGRLEDWPELAGEQLQIKTIVSHQSNMNLQGKSQNAFSSSKYS